MSPRSQRRKVFATATLGAVWLLSLSFGLRSLLSYETTPGASGHPPDSWPSLSKVPRSADQYALVMAAHPNCPCTRASMHELAQIMAATAGKLHAYVLFLKPSKSGSDWDDTPLMRTAAGIPGVTVIQDLDGLEARRFGAQTSGHTLLFDSRGRRLFSGGITGSRGHEGGNGGETAIVRLVKGGRADQNSSFIFGCALTDANDRLNCHE